MAMKIKNFLHKIGIVYHRFLVLVHLSPLSLAEKCRIAFGATILLILSLALTILYIWMGKLTIQGYYSSERTRAEICLREHFNLENVRKFSPLALAGTGLPLDPNKSDILWLRLQKDKPPSLDSLSKIQIKLVNDIIKDRHINESLVFEKKR